MKEQVGILIAVRMKSSRLPKKATRDIIGKPMINHLIERMKRVKNASKIVICTSTHPDDKILLNIADEENVLKYAGSELDVMKRFIEAADENNLKYIVRVTGDNPMTDPGNIDSMIKTHIDGEFDFTKSEYLPIGANAEVISLSALKTAYQLAEDTQLTEYMTAYLLRPDIFKIHMYINNDIFYKNRYKIRLTVDYDEDLQLMNIIYTALYKKFPNFSIREVLEFIDMNPKIVDMNINLYQIPLPEIKFI